MSKANTNHKAGDGLMAGLHVRPGIPSATDPNDITPAGDSGTLTGLATRNSEGVLTRRAQAF